MGWRIFMASAAALANRAAGYAHRLMIWQLEVSLTQVFREPLWGRRFFEAVSRANLDLGRPDQVSLLFPIHRTRRTPPPPAGYRARVITAGLIPGLYVAYKRSHVKQGSPSLTYRDDDQRPQGLSAE